MLKSFIKNPFTESNTWNPWLRATSIILLRVIPGRIVPLIAGVEITLPYNNMGIRPGNVVKHN